VKPYLSLLWYHHSCFNGASSRPAVASVIIRASPCVHYSNEDSFNGFSGFNEDLKLAANNNKHQK
jgi:hypothetical protein